MKKFFLFLCLFLLSGCSFLASPKNFSSGGFGANVTDQKNAESHLISPCGIIDPGGYILFEDLAIAYDGDVFTVSNNREDIVRVSVMVVGVKKDGSYEMLQMPAFCGVDQTQYKKDLAENGWAIEHYSNMIMPNETLTAKLNIVDFGGDFPAADVDNDGYYDIVFTVHPQKDENTISVSTADEESPVYKLPAD